MKEVKRKLYLAGFEEGDIEDIYDKIVHISIASKGAIEDMTDLLIWLSHEKLNNAGIKGAEVGEMLRTQLMQIGSYKENDKLNGNERSNLEIKQDFNKYINKINKKKRIK